MPTRDEFRANLITFSERAQRVRDHLKNEEATKVALVLPFIALLGYDDRDPTEVAAEHASDFSEKYRNRVDYAILRDMQPIIAIECKAVGGSKKDDRGQLKAYFNACRTAKLGLLTDGFVYEFFVDSAEPNMMDDDPFLTARLEDIAKGQISETLLDGLYTLTKAKFDPETIGENARRSLTHYAFYEYLSLQFHDPSPEFTRFLLKENDIKHVRTQAIEGYRAIAKAAFNDVFTANVLRRLDIRETQAANPIRHTATTEEPLGVELVVSDVKTVETTQAELEAFETVRRRLAFLSNGDKELFLRIGEVAFRDYQGKMAVFFEKERKGRLLDIVEGRDGGITFFVSDGGDGSTDITSLDERLIAIFRKRVDEMAPKRERA